ncbi:MAG TPA: Smr/MutS family protein [Polyangiaceae bacterium]|nr:Smr/MutS family protein [Polyangiaceae bacterium]
METRLEALEAHARSALEWPLLLERIAERCTSPAASAYVRALLPAATVAEATLRLDRMRDALALFGAGHPLPVREFPELGELFSRVERDGVASGGELSSLIRVLGLASDLRAYAKKHAAEAPHLAEAVTSEPGLDRLRERLSACIDGEGAVADRASPELSRARSRVREAQSDLKRRLAQLLGRFADLLQGQYYTEREGRFVLPVRSDAHLRVDGIVHGSSASGSTLFVEPRELMEVGNQLRLAEAEAAREEARVLIALSSEVKAALEACEHAFFACVTADLCSAATRWADETESVVLGISEQPTLDLRGARHPLLLLTGIDVVPNDIVLASQSALVISGPNAGGKTVALKTAGLVAWMVRTGLPVPVRAESSVGWFELVLCDIGDEQSITRSLSTFSAHIENLHAILDSATERCLVLLDEIAAGTDPEEGAALAAAVLEALTARGAAVGVTTHYERLKELATQNERFQNASVGFDFERMAPTFRLLLGVAGPSSALAVALRHGMPESVIARAKALLPTQALDRETALRELSRERAELEELTRAAELEREREQELREALETEREAFREQAAREVNSEVSALRLAVRSARKELDTVRARIRGTAPEPALLRELERGVSRVAAQVALGGELGEHGTSGKKPVTRELNPSELRVGQTVFHRALGANGQVIELCERERARIMIGAMKLLVPIHELSALPKGTESQRAKPAPKRPRATQPKPTSTPQRTQDTTLDLRGERVDDALGRVDAFIDRLLGGSEAVGFVLHGHGTGALKSHVREHLRASAYVEHSRPAESDEGGDAFTVFWVRG